MKMKRGLMMMTSIILFSLLFVQCSEDDDTEGIKQKSSLAVKLTDAPSDDADVQGTFVTVSEVKIDGEPVEGFSKQTIEISAYQKGDAKLLLNEDIEAKSYQSLSLVLDYETDESGNTPGCYVLTNDNKKHDLAAESQSMSEFTFSGDFEIEPQSQNTWVIDFDLRKAVAREDDSSTETEYTFVTTAKMQQALRIVKEDNTGEIQGNITSSINTGDDLYVYAYKKGDFDAAVETQPDENVRFAHAVTSAKVQEDGSYTLAFLQEGDYEIYIAAYEQKNAGESEFRTLLDASSQISKLMLDNISVSSETSVEINILITGIL